MSSYLTSDLLVVMNALERNELSSEALNPWWKRSRESLHGMCQLENCNFGSSSGAFWYSNVLSCLSVSSVDC